MDVNTTSNLPPGTQSYYNRVLLENNYPMEAYRLFGQMEDLPANSGTQMKFHRYAKLGAKTTPLSEGVPPSPDLMSVTAYYAKPSQYAGYVVVTDVVTLTNQDKVLNVVTAEQGEQMGLTLDTLCRDILAATASSTNCSGGANGKTPTEITQGDIDGITTSLSGYNIKTMAKRIKATSNVGTVPTGPAYWGICNTSLRTDLKGVTEWVPTHEYASQNQAYDNEIGQTDRVRWVETSIGKSIANSDLAGTSTVYHNLIMGKGFYGMVEMKKGSAKAIYKAPGSAGTADPVDQLQTMGWKAWFVAIILNDEAGHNLKCTLQ